MGKYTILSLVPAWAWTCSVAAWLKITFILPVTEEDIIDCIASILLKDSKKLVLTSEIEVIDNGADEETIVVLKSDCVEYFEVVWGIKDDVDTSVTRIVEKEDGLIDNEGIEDDEEAANKSIVNNYAENELQQCMLFLPNIINKT